MPVDLYIKYCAKLCSRADTCRNILYIITAVAVVDLVFFYKYGFRLTAPYIRPMHCKLQFVITTMTNTLTTVYE